MFEFLKKLFREEMMKRVPNTAKTAPAPNIEEPKPEAPKVLTDDDKLIIKAVKKSNRLVISVDYNPDDDLVKNTQGYSLTYNGRLVAFTRNTYGFETISKAISERINQDREEKRKKLNAMLGD